MKRFFTTILTVSLLLLFPSSAFAAASLFLGTSSKTVYRTASFVVTVNVNAGGQPTNSFQTRVTFDPNMILPMSATSSGSICTLFVANPKINPSDATVTCGIANPGYSGSAGRLMTLTFRAAKAGTTNINIDSGYSQVLANDGIGTNVLGSSSGLTMNIIERPPEAIVIKTPVITSDAGESGSWTSKNPIVMSWSKPEGATKFSYLLTTDKNANPTTDLSKFVTATSTTLKDLADGLYYFRVIASDGEELSDVAEYTFNVDRSVPDSLEIVIEPSPTEPIASAPLIGFTATDKGSGIARYTMSIDGGDFIDVTSPYKFDEITGGEHTITIRAYDQTENLVEKSVTFTVIRIPPPVIQIPFADSVVQINGMLSISGTAERGTVVLIYLDDELIGTAQVSNEGVFLFDHRKAISDGEHTLYAVSRNAGGVLSDESEPTVITIQNTLTPVSSNSLIDQVRESGLFGIMIALVSLLTLFFLFLILKKRREIDDIEERLNEARFEVDQELQDVERHLRNEIESQPLLDDSQEKKLEHAVSSAIDSTDEAITTLLHPDRIVRKHNKMEGNKKKKRKPRVVRKSLPSKNPPVESTSKPVESPVTAEQVSETETAPLQVMASVSTNTGARDIGTQVNQPDTQEPIAQVTPLNIPQQNIAEPFDVATPGSNKTVLQEGSDDSSTVVPVDINSPSPTSMSLDPLISPDQIIPAARPSMPEFATPVSTISGTFSSATSGIENTSTTDIGSAQLPGGGDEIVGSVPVADRPVVTDIYGNSITEPVDSSLPTQNDPTTPKPIEPPTPTGQNTPKATINPPWDPPLRL